MRMLIASADSEVGRWEQVTGLGRGVDRTGRLDESAVADSLIVLAEFGRLMDLHQVERRMAIATSASRDASNRELFFDQAELVLGVRPTLISGSEEGRLAFSGATSGFQGPLPVVVSDIGGGSTELFGADAGVSVDIGSVRLTERLLVDRPVSGGQLEAARHLVAEMLATVDLGPLASLVGVAGTWTEMPGLARAAGWNSVLNVGVLSGVVDFLAALSLTEIEGLPGFNPKRAPVILGGSVIAEAVGIWAGVDRISVSRRDTLDGVVSDLLAQ